MGIFLSLFLVSGYLPCLVITSTDTLSIQNTTKMSPINSGKDSIVHEDTVRQSRLRYDYFQEIAAGYAFGSLGYYLGTIISYNMARSPDTVPTVVKMSGYSLCALGASVGVWWMGNKYFKGNYLATLFSAVLFPSSLAIINKYATKSSKLDKAMDDIIVISLPIGAFLGYNIFKKSLKRN